MHRTPKIVLAEDYWLNNLGKCLFIRVDLPAQYHLRSIKCLKTFIEM